MGATRCLLGVLTVAALSGCHVSIFGWDGNDRDLDVEVSESFDLDLDAAQRERLTVEGVNGSVTIAGSSGSTVAQVRAERRVRSNTRADARDFLTRVDVEVEELGNEIRIRTRQPSNTGGREVIVDYDLVIPSHLEVRVVNVNGAIDVRSVDGTVEVDNINGAVSVVGAIGDVDVVLINGNITCDAMLAPGGHIDLSVINGNIGLDVPASVSAMLEADVVNGTVSVAGLTVHDATTSARALRGRLGAGDGLIDLDTTNGTITVRGR